MTYDEAKLELFEWLVPAQQYCMDLMNNVHTMNTVLAGPPDLCAYHARLSEFWDRLNRRQWRRIPYFSMNEVGCIFMHNVASTNTFLIQMEGANKWVCQQVTDER